MTKSAFALQSYCRLKVSEERLVRIKCYLVFSGVKLLLVKLSLQAP